MKITLDDILKKMKAEDIPYEAIFASGQPKKVAWGGYEILNSLYHNELDWYYEQVDFASMDEYMKACDKLAENNHVIIYCIRKYDSNYQGGKHINFGLICDEEMRNAIELVGGLEQYIKLGG